MGLQFVKLEEQAASRPLPSSIECLNCQTTAPFSRNCGTKNGTRRDCVYVIMLYYSLPQLSRSIDLQLVHAKLSQSFTSGWRTGVEIRLLGQRGYTGAMSWVLAGVIPACIVNRNSVRSRQINLLRTAGGTAARYSTYLLSQMALVLGVHLNRTWISTFFSYTSNR